jgi:Ca2+-transporting ATPase
VDESSFTGETEPSLKHTDPLPADVASQSLLKRKNVAFMGTLVKSGHGKGIVICTGENSVNLNQVLHLIFELC